MSKANYLKRSLIEAGIGSTLGLTSQALSAAHGKETRDNIAIAGLKGALLGGAMVGGLGQVSRMARSAGKFKNQIGTHARYKSLADEAKNLESRMPLVKWQLDNWDQASRMEGALLDLRKAQDPSTPAFVQNLLRDHSSADNLNVARLEKVHGSLSESLKKFDRKGVKSKEIDEISKGIETLKGSKRYAESSARKSKRRLTEGFELLFNTDRDHASDLAQDLAEKYVRRRRKGMMDKSTYSVATHIDDNFPTIRLEIKDKKVGSESFPSLVTAQDATYWVTPKPKKKIFATHKAVRDKHGDLILSSPKDNRPGTLIVKKTIKKGTPFKKLRQMDYNADTVPDTFFDSPANFKTRANMGTVHSYLTTKEKAPKGYHWGSVTTPFDKMLMTGQTPIEKFDRYVLRNTQLDSTIKDLRSNKERLLKIKDDMKTKQRAISDVRRDVSDIVREQQQELKTLLQRPRRIVEEREAIRKSLREQMENDVYGKWFGVF